MGYAKELNAVKRRKGERAQTGVGGRRRKTGRVCKREREEAGERVR